MRAQANWTAWTLHGIYGLLIGAIVGTLAVYNRHGSFFDKPLRVPFLIGACLIGAGLGSRFGDRLWIGDSYRMIPPDEPPQSKFSGGLSWFIAAAGVVTCIVTVLKQFGIV